MWPAFYLSERNQVAARTCSLATKGTQERSWSSGRGARLAPDDLYIIISIMRRSFQKHAASISLPDLWMWARMALSEMADTSILC